MTKVLLRIYIGLVAFSGVGSILAHTLHLESQAVAAGAGLLVLLAGASLVAIDLGDARRSVLVLVMCGLVEAVGVSTGIPFGRYVYTDRWFPTVPLPNGMAFPLGVPFAWLMLAGGCYLVAGLWTQTAWKRVALTAMLTTAIDLPLEDVMTRVLGYWHWLEPGQLWGAPILNSVGWWVVACVCGTLFATGQRAVSRTSAAYVLAGYCALMGELGFLNGRASAWPLLVLAVGFGAVAVRKSKESSVEAEQL